MYQPNQRLRSVDVLRGIAVLGMLLADFPGSWEHMFAPLQHVHWNGLTQTDLVFPIFLFVIGVSISLGFHRRLELNTDHKNLIIKIIKRSLVLFGLGLLTNIFYSYPAFQWNSFRIMGVLQRIAIVYMAGSFLSIYFENKKMIIISGVILIAYWGLLILPSVPGFGRPDIYNYPDGIANNLAAWVDMKVLGSHVFAWSKPWDPEGLMSTLPALVNVIAGIVTGRWLLGNKKEAERTVWMFAAAAALILAGYLWSLFFPVNKKIWTSSYAVLTSGIALASLAWLYWLLDIKKYRIPDFMFTLFGKNAIGIFTACYLVDGALYHIPVKTGKSSMMLRDWFYQTFYASWLPEIWASLAYTLVFIAFWFVFFKMMDNRGVQFKV